MGRACPASAGVRWKQAAGRHVTLQCPALCAAQVRRDRSAVAVQHERMSIEPTHSSGSDAAATPEAGCGSCISRRAVLAGVGGAAVAALTAAPVAALDASSRLLPGSRIARTRDVPVGGGVIVRAGGRSIVITQPRRGQFRAFSAVCTHAGEQISKIEEGRMVCTEHFSYFELAGGKPTNGPARRPLTPVQIRVNNKTGVIRLA